MDKIVFLATLAGKLSEYQMPSDAVESSLEQVKSYIDRVSDAEFAADPASEEDVEAIAKDIYDKYLDAQAAKEKAEEAEALAAQAAEEAEEAVTEDTAEQTEDDTDEPMLILDMVAEESKTAAEPSDASEISENDAVEEAKETVVEQIFSIDEDEPPAPEEIIEQLVIADEYVKEEAPKTSDEDFFEMLAKEAEGERTDLERIKELELKALAMANKDDPEMVAQVLSQDKELVEMVAASDIADEFDPIEAVFDPTQRPDMALEEADLAETLFEENEEFASELMVDKEELKKLDEKAAQKKKKKKVKEPKEKVKGSPLFWTLFILTLPITLPLYLVVCVFFGILYVAVSALIAVFGVATVATTLVGTVVFLVSVISGIIQCFKNTAIGLFEIGVGIAVGGAAMLISVLLYNMAVRCVPLLYKLINRFGGWAFGGIAKLYTNVKKECGKKK